MFRIELKDSWSISFVQLKMYDFVVILKHRNAYNIQAECIGWKENPYFQFDLLNSNVCVREPGAMPIYNCISTFVTVGL